MDFKTYVKENWLNISEDERGWYVTRDVSLTLKYVTQDGWKVELTGETQMMPDDSIRTYFKVI